MMFFQVKVWGVATFLAFDANEAQILIFVSEFPILTGHFKLHKSYINCFSL
jgi:hypothetical protein